MSVVLLIIINAVIMMLLLVCGLPLLVACFATRRPGFLTALRIAIALSLGLLGFVNANVLLVLAGLAVAFWPSSLESGERARLRPGAARLRSLPALGVRGRKKVAKIDPSALGGLWSRLLRSALAAREQFAAATRRAPAGAIREQLDDLTAEVDRALLHAWELARRGAELEGAGNQIEAANRAARRSALRWGRGWRPAPEDDRVVEAQQARDEAARRLIRAIDEERAQLQVLVARLGEAACSAAELAATGQSRAISATSEADLGGELVDRLTALRGALVEISAIRPAA
ncbi:MAG: hypothetical protein GEU81_10755 [Nitriliruptorales bacterium]|nr:hypothetical protein [Nitriliruptorales bacterium]